MTGPGPGQDGDLAGQPEEMAAEFGTVAGWTWAAVQRLGQDYALPAACRGSGSPQALRWLGERLALSRGELLLDCGAGLGGPAAVAAAEFGARPVLAEPMPEASRASASMFGLPAVTAAAQHLPFRAGSFGAAWCLGVLCTVPDQAAVLASLRRVLRPGGRLGLLVYLRETDELPCVPSGNNFPDAAGLSRLLGQAGFEVTDRAELDAPGPAPADWLGRAEEVERVLDREHAGQEPWLEAQRQQDCMGQLLASGAVRGQLSCAVAR